MQRLLAAGLMAVLVFVFYRMGRLFLPHGWSLLLALAGGFATPIWSTASRALWPDTWGVLLLGVAVLLVVRLTKTGRAPNAALLASVLAWAVFAKPVHSLSVVTVTLFIALRHRRLLPLLVATGSLWVALLVMHSWIQCGRPLPSYYLLGRGSRLHLTGVLDGLAGVMLNPSRGLLVYVPAVLFIGYQLARYWQHVSSRSLLCLGFASCLLQIALTAAWEMWHGGFAYGPRLLVGLIPWIVLLALIGTEAMVRARAEAVPSNLAWRGGGGAGGLLLVLSVLIQARGATAPETWTWNKRLTVEEFEAALWDWHSPQMLAGWAPLTAPSSCPLLPRGTRMNITSAEAFPHLLGGWSDQEGDHRWTVGRKAGFAFRFQGRSAAELRLTMWPFVRSGLLETQRLNLRLNGKSLATLMLSDPRPREHRFNIREGFLTEENILILQLPDARTPQSLGLGPDESPLGVAVSWIELR